MDRMSLHRSTGSCRGPGLSPRHVLLLALWCGLVAGLLEVGMIVFKAHALGPNRFYHMSRHFVWLIPLGNLMLFLELGLILAIATWFWRMRGGWLSTRLLCALTLLPAVLVAGPQIHSAAWLIALLGISARLVPMLERSGRTFRRLVSMTLPVLACVVAILPVTVFARDKLRAWREAVRPLPPTDSPNVLLIVLDTVRADHLSLYGYPRPTTPNLERFAQRGVRFDQARATASWTLPSHASMFTGRWHHELPVDGYTPLDATYPTLAEFIGSHGYATAGFVGNTIFCAYDSGLARGFTHYEDFYISQLSGLRMAKLVDPALSALRRVTNRFIWRFGAGSETKVATLINRQFLSWLSNRQQPERPFFAFLNYRDAHAPYILPDGSPWLLGGGPHDKREWDLLGRWEHIDNQTLSEDDLSLGRNAYDNCLAYLDQELGRLFDEMDRRGALDRTLVIITADHGEGFGEHGLFDHGHSLYRPEIRVPLIFLIPSRTPANPVIAFETVSLRDLPATIVEVLGLQDGSPFPGTSLSSFWEESESSRHRRVDRPVLSEVGRSGARDRNGGRSPTRRGSMVSLADGDYVYIRNQGDGQEEFYNVRDDPDELKNLIDSKEGQPVLQHLRDTLVQFEGGFPPQFRRRTTGAPSIE